MVHVTIVVSVLALLLGMSGLASCQGIPACYPAPYPADGSCDTRPSLPRVVKTVQVDVPVPCPPPAPCAPYPCCAPPCPAPCPTRPVKVQVEVVVRPEPCGQKRQGADDGLDLGPMGPVVGLMAAIMATPIQLLEGIFPGFGPCVRPRPMLSPSPGAPGFGSPLRGASPFAPGADTPPTLPVSRVSPAPVAPCPSCVPPAACGPFHSPAPVLQRVPQRSVCRPFAGGGNAR